MKISNQMLKFLNDQSGASAVEYALILAIVGSGIAAAIFLGGAISGAINEAGTCITNRTAVDCT